MQPQRALRRPLLERAQQIAAEGEDLVGVAQHDLPGIGQHVATPAAPE